MKISYYQIEVSVSRKSDVFDDNSFDHFQTTGVICFCIHCIKRFSKSIERFLFKIKK